jgi:hypothetical protein
MAQKAEGMSAQTDISKFLAGLEKFLQRQAVPAAMRAVNQFSHKVLADAQRLAPVGGGIYSPRDPQPGRLKDSATAGPVEIDDQLRISQVIGFNTEYAAVQHERLDFRHDQGQAKYLEIPLRRLAPKLPEFIMTEIKRS